jgi:hypothetical protein
MERDKALASLGAMARLFDQRRPDQPLDMLVTSLLSSVGGYAGLAEHVRIALEMAQERQKPGEIMRCVEFIGTMLKSAAEMNNNTDPSEMSDEALIQTGMSLLLRMAQRKGVASTNAVDGGEVATTETG